MLANSGSLLFSSNRHDDWNALDALFFDVFSPANLLSEGMERLDKLLHFVETASQELMPDRMYLQRSMKYSRKKLIERMSRASPGEHTSFSLSRSAPPDAHFRIWSGAVPEDGRSGLSLSVSPFPGLREEGKEGMEHGIIALVRALAGMVPVSYGYSHGLHDTWGWDEPKTSLLRTPERVEQVYWLNIYGPSMVERLGREHLLRTPAWHMEELPNGAVLWLTRPTPADFNSEEARLAQARALAHLRPDLRLEEIVSTLRQRSLAFVPVPCQFHPDVVEILAYELPFVRFQEKRGWFERYNAYQPPPVSEWCPAHSLPEPDVEDVAAAVEEYEAQLAEMLSAALEQEVPSAMEQRPESLPHVDWYFWHFCWGSMRTQEEKERVLPLLGAYLGKLLVHALGGRWVPRRNLEETAVVIGERAWLPFLRARNALRSQQATLDHSLTQLFREAQRLRMKSFP